MSEGLFWISASRWKVSMDEVIGAELISPRASMGREGGSQETSWVDHGPCLGPFLQAMTVHAKW
eukprot:3141442-Ditylum_brightwellii.AAC.1